VGETSFANRERGAADAVQSLSKALDLLEAFSFEEPEMALGELSLKVGLAKSTVHKLLRTLVLRGYVAQDPSTRRYRLGLRNWQLGTLAASRLDVRHVAAPHLRRLAELTGEQVTLWVSEQDVVVCVERIDSRHQLRTYTRLGTVADPMDLAAGRCLLAFRPPSQWPDLLSTLAARRDPPPAVEAMTARLAQIVERGYDVTDRSVAANGCGLAAPIRGNDGRIVAATTVSGPVERFDHEMTEALVPQLLGSAARISADLGYRPEVDRSQNEGARL
jgi:DNA-binding IclR family transcriptional regulator